MVSLGFRSGFAPVSLRCRSDFALVSLGSLSRFASMEGKVLTHFPVSGESGVSADSSGGGNDMGCGGTLGDPMFFSRDRGSIPDASALHSFAYAHPWKEETSLLFLSGESLACPRTPRAVATTWVAAVPWSSCGARVSFCLAWALRRGPSEVGLRVVAGRVGLRSEVSCRSIGVREK